jgi:hypothetical protein
VGLARAIDLFFAGHAPWSLYLLGIAAFGMFRVQSPWWAEPAVGLIPLVLTVRIVAAFFAEVLRLDRAAVRRMTALHQAATWTVFVAVNWAASAFTPRLIQWWRL